MNDIDHVLACLIVQLLVGKAPSNIYSVVFQPCEVGVKPASYKVHIQGTYTPQLKLHEDEGNITLRLAHYRFIAL